MFCEWKSPAAKRYQLTVLIEMLAYTLIIFGVQGFVGHHHPAPGQRNHHYTIQFTDICSRYS